MAQETQTGVEATAETDRWRAGIVAGLAGGVVMGILLTMMMRPVIAVAIPALYGLSGMAVGWVAHLFHSAVFGVIFAALAGQETVGDYTDSVGGSIGVGVAYGVLIWIVAAAFVMPIWLSAVGFPNAPPLPNFNPMSLVGHVVFGLVLGSVYPYAR